MEMKRDITNYTWMYCGYNGIYDIYCISIYICRYNILGGVVDITFMAITTVNKTPHSLVWGP